MSKKMTPCEKLGYKVGDKFKVSKSGSWFNVGEEVELGRDDGSNYPYFFNARMPKDSYGGWPRHIESVEKISNAKLKPAKQALADAIHQGGGWPKEGHWMFAASNGFGSAFCWTDKPKRSGWNWLGGGKFTPCCEIGASIPNWHQCVLSRDEYFTAYPEKVNVEIKNETEQKVEVEMKSESEMTIKAGGDWHKNGELPPVGEVCEMKHKHSTADWARPGFEPVVIVASGKDLFIVSGTDVYRETVGSWDEYEFRPLRTEREKAVDEMACEFIDHYGDPKGGERYLGIATKLYDSGYRKEVK